MAAEIFARGIPISSLSGRAQELAEQLDQSPLIARQDNNHLDSGHIEPDEALAAVRALDNWSDPGDQAILEKFATVLGVAVAAHTGPMGTSSEVEEPDDSVVNDIDLILTSITTTTAVGFPEVTNNHVEMDNGGQALDVDVLDYQPLRNNHIAVDIDANFFCRTSWNGQPLMSVGQDAEGKRYLFGIQRDGRSALPKECEFVLCATSGVTMTLQTDHEGRFAAELPAGIGGIVTIARIDSEGHGVGAQAELP